MEENGQDFDKKKVCIWTAHSIKIDRRISWEKLDKSGVNKLLKKLWDTGTVDSWPGSDTPRSVCTEENVETVND